jgi:3-isopropylmalate dehydratase
LNGRQVRRSDLTLATSDHNVPTTSRKDMDESSYIRDAESRLQCRTLKQNAKQHRIRYFDLRSANQGIVHVIGPELGFTLPGMTMVCGDSHTSTHGAFGALAFGIGTTEVEHVLATQTLISNRLKNMKVQVEGQLAPCITSKDIILYIIKTISSAGGTGMVIEYAGSTIRGLSMESRMSLCNMSVEAGAKAGLISPDETTIEYMRGRPLVSMDSDQWKRASDYWLSLKSDPDAVFDRVVEIEATDINPHVTWGTSPDQVVPITEVVPYPPCDADERARKSHIRALEYMNLEPGTPMQNIKIDKVFIGSCTNARLEDLRAAAHILQGASVSPDVKLALAVPGSGLVKAAAEREGLDIIFKKAGFEWREAGCSLCVGLNEDMLLPTERCASTSNRNFEDRQGAGGRTHLMSPVMAAAAAIKGHLTDARILLNENPRPERHIMLHTAEIVPLLDREDGNTDMSTASKSSSGDARGFKSDGNDSSKTPRENSTAESSTASSRVFHSWKGRMVPLNMSSVDTDCIIPKQFLKSIGREGFSKGLFYYLRHTSREGTPEEDPSFTLNQHQYRGTSILLVTGENFGCGSSREHAVWALQGWGFKCVLAPSFGDIFYNNCFQTGLLPVRITSPSLLKDLTVEAEACREIVVDLLTQTIYRAEDKYVLGTFTVEEQHREKLISGSDNISDTLKMNDDIERFETQQKTGMPWLQVLPPLISEIARSRIVSQKSKIEW